MYKRIYVGIVLNTGVIAAKKDMDGEDMNKGDLGEKINGGLLGCREDSTGICV